MLREPYELPSPEERSPIAADFLVRWQARLVLAHRAAGLFGAEGIRSDLELAPHQARTVLEVLSAPRVRHVLADEVGMGKTIEALMVYQALRIERPKLRTFVLVPGHLTYQWLGEIYLRAHRVFAIASEDRQDALELASDVLLDREWLTGKRGEAGREKLREKLQGRAPADSPRLLIVDEAHRLSKAGYELVQDLCRSVEHVLLLTATPVELEAKRTGKKGDQLRYEELLRLLDPKLKGEELEGLREAEARVQTALQAHPSNVGVAKAWCEALASSLGDDPRARALAARAGETGSEDDTQDLLDYVASRGLAAWRVLRHRRADAPRVFRKRVAHVHTVAPLDGFLETAGRIEAALAKAGKLDDDARHLLERARSVSVESYAAALEKISPRITDEDGPEVRADDELANGHAALERLAKEEDPKLVRLKETIQEAWALDRKAGKKTLRKFLVFVPDRDTLERAQHFLELELSTDVAVFHAGLDNTLRPDGEPPERLQQLLAFRNAPSTAILLCTDIAAEGHNLHSACHTVVLYDLPRNPNTTEQRIGRVDRLGQNKDVAVHVLLLEGTMGPAECARQAKLGVFEHSLGALAPSEEEALAEGKTIEESQRRDLTSPLRALRNKATPELEDRVRQGLEAPRGWVFRASTKFEEWYGEAHLAQACLGSLMTRAAARAFDLKAQKSENPPPGVRESLRFRLARGDEPIPGYRDTWGTCDRDEALVQDHLQFFASGHPFVEDVLGRATGGDQGARQALRLRLQAHPSPRRGVLCHFVWDPAAGLGAGGERLVRLARVVYPILSVPVVVSVAASGKVEVEAGPPEKEKPSLRRDLLSALVELDPNVCESSLDDPVGPEEVVPWVTRARAAALEQVRARLSAPPSRLGARALARCGGEIARDATLPGRAELEALVEKAIPELGRSGLESALVLDSLATFELVDPRQQRR